ncbi:MAG: aspartate--ammonia ligase [Acholeplasmatales bacterium]|nr:aspartate--ammonia ligase [Acholeplasmatales bacterium]
MYNVPKNYKEKLNIKDTQYAIKKLKDFFERDLAKALNLLRVSAPLFVRTDSGLNDNLNGVERPVTFEVNGVTSTAEIVHSLAKWKRYALDKYGFKVGTGLYTDMNAIRKDEELDAIHSVFVDQWDWEKIITKSERNLETLKSVVRIIYGSLKRTEEYIKKEYPVLDTNLSEDITFITTQELEDEYPSLSPKMREYEACKKYGSIFLIGIGGNLKSGKPHDLRAPDYDDWNLNGDIIVYFKTLDIALEISSMGIRVDEESLVKQLKLTNHESRLDLPFQNALVEGKLPYTIGGGIGQSRMCMFFLEKAHIGEVQSSVWPKSMLEEYKKNGINLL